MSYQSSQEGEYFIEPSVRFPIVIVGAGPAGLTAAYELTKRGQLPLVLESGTRVGGLARTENYRGYRFDIGGHRFYTKVDEVQQLWHEVLDDEFLLVRRLSRIYYNGKFFNYPLDLANTVSNLGFLESTRILLSFLKAKVFPYRQEDTFEQWVSNRFGRRLYGMFFGPYTEKVWGIPGEKIQAEWAAQRIRGLSLRQAVTDALFGSKDVASLIDEFHYPVLGPGLMWQRFCEAIEAEGAQVWLESEVIGLEHHEDGRWTVSVAREGETCQVAADQVISSMPITHLIRMLAPEPPPPVLAAAKELKYRDFILVCLIVEEADLFPDNWIYVHSADARVGRIQNFKNWSAAMVPDPDKSCLGMEYFCTVDDDIWRMSDEELIELAGRELVEIGLARESTVRDGIVIRQRKAYPVYDQAYREHLADLRAYLNSVSNLQTIGRNGLHRYNNQDHSMLTAVLAARNIMGEHHDVWLVNTERSYYEGFQTE